MYIACLHFLQGSVPTDQLGGQKLQLSDIKKLKNMYKCCQNIHSSCQYWADKGFCATGHQYEKFMKRDCAAACRIDKKSSCKSWARKGYCVHTYVKYVNENCPKACGGKC